MLNSIGFMSECKLSPAFVLASRCRVHNQELKQIDFNETVKPRLYHDIADKIAELGTIKVESSEYVYSYKLATRQCGEEYDVFHRPTCTEFTLLCYAYDKEHFNI
jgi:hypothetical protein